MATTVRGTRTRGNGWWAPALCMPTTAGLDSPSHWRALIGDVNMSDHFCMSRLRLFTEKTGLIHKYTCNCMYGASRNFMEHWNT